MSFPIKHKQILSLDIKRIDVFAANIAQRVKPGQFVSVSPESGDERIPLTVIDSDFAKGTISLIFQEVGPTTKKLGAMAINETIYSILGPLGMPAAIEKKGTVVCVATGLGAAQILPIIRALKKVGNKVIGIMGSKTRKSLLLESQMRTLCQKLFITTNDGSYERKGLATDVLKTILSKEEVHMVYAIGSAEMMQAASEMTKERNIPTRVQLNPMMVDCMGMCGSCRVKVDGKVVLACIEGPEFDGHKVDFNHFQIRIQAFEELEWRSQKLHINPKKDESKTLVKFLSGFLKK